MSISVVAGAAFLAAQALASDAIVVTAHRTLESAADVTAPVTVIDRETIERSNARDLRELIVGAPGLDASANGAFGKVTGVFLRGTNSDHVLTIVDGVKLYSATLGTTAFELIPLEQIERVEIVRGPRSAQWGADAIGGVVHIFTRRGGEGSSASASAGVGADRTHEITAGAGGVGERSRYSLHAAWIETGGIDVLDDDHPDDDPYENASVSGSLAVRIAESMELDVSLIHAEGESDFDNPFVGPEVSSTSDFVQQVAQAKLDIDVSTMWSTSIAVARSRDESTSFDGGVAVGRFETTRQEVRWQNDIEVGTSFLLTIGVDHSSDEVDSSVAFDISSRDNTGVFTQIQMDRGRHRLALGLRRDDNEQFGDTTTGSIDYGFDLGETVRLIAGVGTAFKAPSFNQLYFPGFGNPDLGPEESESYEVGVEGRPGWGRWSMRIYHTEIEDLINTNLVTFAPENIGRAEIDGLELELGARAGSWDLSSSITVLDPRDAATDRVLRRRARHTLRLAAERRTGRWGVRVSVLAQGRRFEDTANTIELDAYELVDLKVDYAVTGQVTIELAVDNLTDEDYETADGFNERGRSLFLRARYRR